MSVEIATSHETQKPRDTVAFVEGGADIRLGGSEELISIRLLSAEVVNTSKSGLRLMPPEIAGRIERIEKGQVRSIVFLDFSTAQLIFPQLDRGQKREWGGMLRGCSIAVGFCRFPEDVRDKFGGPAVVGELNKESCRLTGNLLERIIDFLEELSRAEVR